jgi:hypothetical protein
LSLELSPLQQGDAVEAEFCTAQEVLLTVMRLCRKGWSLIFVTNSFFRLYLVPWLWNGFV